ncbi:MAG: hypothetical protein FJ134_01490 [Deltaproteobacteria bacterium]|nr:hypothetical protein [Deltaproteobacteria bacterium]
MGTSAARRGPLGPRWSLARRTATRYLAGEASSIPAARELAARYVAALEETAAQEGRDLLGTFRLTRRTAQNLGEFMEQVRSGGWEMALAKKGLSGMEAGEGAISLTAAVLGGADGSLEAAVARTALAQVLGEGFPGPAHKEPRAAQDGVRRFLAAALYLRLALDLGETLEAASRDASRLRQGMETLKTWVEQAAAQVPVPPMPPASPWQGLAGWAWITRVLEGLVAGVRGQGIGNRE